MTIEHSGAPRLLTAEDVIELLGGGLKAETLHEWARDGKIGSVKIGRRRMFTDEDVATYIEINRSAQTDYGRSARSRTRR